MVVVVVVLGGGGGVGVGATPSVGPASEKYYLWKKLISRTDSRTIVWLLNKECVDKSLLTQMKYIVL